MTRDNDMIIARIKGVETRCGTAETDAAAGNPNVNCDHLEKRIAELEAALKPFADAVSYHHGKPGVTQFDVADFVRAKALLKTVGARDA